MPGDDVCPKGPAHTTADVQPSPQHAGGEIEPGRDREITAPLPSAQNVARCTLGNKPPVLAEWQIVNPVPREFVPLIEAGKPAVRWDVKRILRHNASPAAYGRRVIDGLRKHIL